MIKSEHSERDKLEHKYKDLIEVNQSLSRQIVSFQANKKIPIYNWFSFKEGFSSEMIKLFIRESTKKKGIILDPFAGSCTTLLSARENGFSSFGIELMPIGRFILDSKLILETYEIVLLSEKIKDLKKVVFEKYPENAQISFKHIKITEKAFSKITERKLNGFLNYISNIEDLKLRQIFSFACFSILEKISYTRKDGQYLRWDYRAKKGKTKFDKGKIYDFEDALFSQLNQILSDLRNMILFNSTYKTECNIELKSGSCLEILPTLDNDSFDLVISSPSYCNRYDYTRTYALELVYLGIDEKGIRELRQNLLSATVENKDKIEYLKNIYKKNNREMDFAKAEHFFNNNSALQEILTILERHKEQKTLNNPGICRMVRNYFYEHAFVIMELGRTLKKGGIIYYVNDNVRYAGEVIPVDLILSEFALNSGLKVKKIYKLQNGKGNSSQQMGKHGRQEVRKCVYFWEK
jgi:DNA modification methylase